MKSSDINLLKAKTMLTPQLVAIEGQLRIVSLVLLILLFSTGLFFGVGYVIFRRQHENLSAQKQSLISAITRELRKEGLYASMRDRLAIAGRIVENQRSWVNIMDLINRVTSTGSQTSFTLGENDDVSLNIESDTLEETFGIIDRVLAEVSQRTMVNPVLQSVLYKEDGTVFLSLTFTPVF